MLPIVEVVRISFRLDCRAFAVMAEIAPVRTESLAPSLREQMPIAVSVSNPACRSIREKRMPARLRTLSNGARWGSPLTRQSSCN